MENKESYDLYELYSKKPKKLFRGQKNNIRWGWSIVMAVFIIQIAGIGYIIIRYFIDQRNYNKGYKAYQQADCTSAISHFDNVINAWQLIDIGEYSIPARRIRAECVSFKKAVDKQQEKDFRAAFVAYADFVIRYSNSVLSGVARNRVLSIFEQIEPSSLACQSSCEKIDILLKKELIPHRNLPSLFLACGQFYDAADNYQNSFAMYERLLTEYPEHPFSDLAEKSLAGNPVSCDHIDSLQKNNYIVKRPDFIPLARSIVARTKAGDAAELPAPILSGNTGRGFSKVITQNDSPTTLRIVFNGKESRIGQLGPCSLCRTYYLFKPLYCPEMGPMAHYTLKPGKYDIVIESISKSRTTPFKGTWNLGAGGEYFYCIVLTTK